MIRAIHVADFVFSFKATGCLDLPFFNVDCEPENDNTLNFSKRSLYQANLRHNCDQTSNNEAC